MERSGRGSESGSGRGFGNGFFFGLSFYASWGAIYPGWRFLIFVSSVDVGIWLFRSWEVVNATPGEGWFNCWRRVEEEEREMVG